MNLTNLIAKKRYGFYVTLALGLLMLVSGIIYAVNYQSDFLVLYGKVAYNPGISVCLILGGLITLAMAIWDVTSKYAPFVGAIGVLTSLCLYIKAIYYFVMNCFVDIDYHMEDLYQPVVFTFLVFIIITFVLSLVACFLPQIKEEEKTNEKLEEGVASK